LSDEIEAKIDAMLGSNNDDEEEDFEALFQKMRVFKGTRMFTF